jgi:hypothetical protein
MPSLSDVVRALDMYGGRYECLDAFVDDIDELRAESVVTGARRLEPAPRPIVETWIGDRRLSIEIFSDQGVARFRLLGMSSKPPSGEFVGIGAAFGGALGAAVGAASETKEGLLGGLVLGMLVGGALGAAATPTPVERALALRFDPTSSTWSLYDGPLLTWAKRALIPH